MTFEQLVRGVVREELGRIFTGAQTPTPTPKAPKVPRGGGQRASRIATKANAHECGWCGKAFDSERGRRSHLRQAHRRKAGA